MIMIMIMIMIMNLIMIADININLFVSQNYKNQMFRSFILKCKFSIPQYNASKDYYNILGISKNATEAEIKKAFFKLAKKYHPDMSKGNKNHQAIFKDANEAYSVLSDQKLKRQYDAVRGGGGGGYSQSPFGGFSKQQSYQNNPYQQQNQGYQQQQQRYRWTQNSSSKPNWNDPNFQAEILNELFRMQSQARRGGNNKSQYDFVKQTMDEYLRNQDQARRQQEEDYMKRFEQQLRRSYERRQERTRQINQKIDKTLNTVKQGVVNVVGGVADLVGKAKDWWNRKK